MSSRSGDAPGNSSVMQIVSEEELKQSVDVFAPAGGVMAEVHIDELERALVLLKMSANEQKQRLEEDLPSPVADAVRDSLRNIYDKIYWLTAVREAMNVTEPYGFIH